MRITMILPALTEATSPLFRPIKYSLFPPLGLATLAGYLRPDDEVTLHDEHVERLRLDDDRPGLVVIQAYITSARRSYELADAYRARGVHVAMGGLHVTSLPDEAAAHADTVFVGPGEDTWPRFLADFRRGEPRRRYTSTTRTLEALPSFVFGMDGDRPDVFDRTVDWAVGQGIETATFHIMTPYPGTALYERMAAQGRIVHRDWDRYDTRHVVFTPHGMTPEQLEDGYWRAYREFYRWSALWRGARTKELPGDRVRHLAYAGGWKKFEPAWDLLIRTGRVLHALPLLEATLGSFGARTPDTEPARPQDRRVAA